MWKMLAEAGLSYIYVWFQLPPEKSNGLGDRRLNITLTKYIYHQCMFESLHKIRCPDEDKHFRSLVFGEGIRSTPKLLRRYYVLPN